MNFPVLTLSSNRFSILTLRQASFIRLRTGGANRQKKSGHFPVIARNAA
ncbi:MAG: hypothetical protein LBD67_00425 [Candidatus Accumulibacter sp.]|nr:hypothetical protein [Accumulibacter sp.]